jgi:LPS O-antigen subunit length determinant protein (WzzB/FepE family)
MGLAEQSKYSNIDLIKFLIRNLKPILAITILGAIVSIVISIIITPKFKSTTIIYPASTSSVSKALLTDMTMSPKDVLKFGEELETEQLMQIFQSDEIKSWIIQKYDLVKHYKIDTNSKFYKTLLISEYEENISFQKTEYQAIEIKVLDTDAKTAADIANDIAALLDSVYNKIQKERALKALELVEKVYNDQEQIIKVLEDSLSVINSLGIYDYDLQGKLLGEAYAKAISSGNEQSANTIKQKLNNFTKYGSSFVSLKTQHEGQVQQLVFLKSKLAEAKVDAYNDLPHKYIVNKAEVAEIKAYPKRSFIVIFSTFASFIFSIFLILIFERFKEIKNELAK